MTEEDDFDLNDAQTPQEAFHLELDLYDNGEYSNLLFIPCNDVFIVASNNEHFTTMVRNGKGIDAWEQLDGEIEDEIFEKLVIGLEGYIDNQGEKEGSILEPGIYQIQLRLNATWKLSTFGFITTRIYREGLNVEIA